MHEDSSRDMAKFQPSAGIDHISGVLSPKKGDPCAQRLTAKHVTISADCNRLYLGPKPKRTTAVTPAEQLIQGKFSTVTAAVLVRKADLSKLSADQARWAAARKNGDPHRTFRGWLFAKGWENYDEETGQVIWPSEL